MRKGFCIVVIEYSLGALRLSRRRKQRYCQGRRRWEQAYQQGLINNQQLQAGYDAIVGMILHADATTWRRQQLQRVPLTAELEAL